MWIHEHERWPNFAWDTEKLATGLAEVRHRQGYLLGRMEGLGFELRAEANLRTLTSEVVQSSSIEGQHLDAKEVRSSVARRLGIDAGGLVASGPPVEGIVEMMLDATGRFDSPLTKERLLNWQGALFPTGRSGLQRIVVGDWRPPESDPMRVVSGPMGRGRVHFEAPGGKRIEAEMARFLRWFEGEGQINPVLKAGVAHLWFVTIHPFEDGNGRISRAIADMALARGDGMPERFYSLSTQIEAERDAYYEQLERQQRGTPEITGWLEWFTGCLDRAVHNAEGVLDRVLMKAQLWRSINRQLVSDRQRLVINRMLEEGFKGHMNTSRYARMAKCSRDTALRDIQHLQTLGIFIRNAGAGRSTSYRLPAPRGSTVSDQM